jgi:Protein of unknown function (DUF2934)
MSHRATERFTESNEALAKLRSAVVTESSGASEVLSASPSHEEIAERAYQIFLERGAEHGHDVEDWFRAEQELVAELTLRVRAATA